MPFNELVLTSADHISRRLRPWYRVTPSTWLGVMPKCGSSSVRVAITRRYTGSERFIVASKIPRELRSGVPGRGQLLAIVRNPVARFCSLWRNQCRDGVPGVARPTKRRSITPEELFTICLKQDNPHYYKQSYLLKWTDNVIRLEMLDDWWLKETNNPLERWNASEVLLTDDDLLTDSLLSKVAEFYSEDMQMYLSAKNAL